MARGTAFDSCAAAVVPAALIAALALLLFAGQTTAQATLGSAPSDTLDCDVSALGTPLLRSPPHIFDPDGPQHSPPGPAAIFRTVRPSVSNRIEQRLPYTQLYLPNLVHSLTLRVETRMATYVAFRQSL